MQEEEIKKEEVTGAGRPTLYTDETNQKALDYIDSCEDEEVQQLTGLSMKGTELFKNKLDVNLPTVEGLSIHLDVSRDTLYEWAKVHPEFSDTLEKLKAKQANELISKGLSGDYNPTITKLLLSANHGMKEKTEQDITSKGQSIGGFQFIRNDIPDNQK